MMKTPDDQVTEQLIKITTGGNPGAMSVLAQLMPMHSFKLSKLAISMGMTGSDCSDLWRLYKDVCAYDIKSTHEELKNWYGKDCTLGQYVDEVGNETSMLNV
jgi:hypothetical protein